MSDVRRLTTFDSTYFENATRGERCLSRVLFSEAFLLRGKARGSWTVSTNVRRLNSLWLLAELFAILNSCESNLKLDDKGANKNNFIIGSDASDDRFVR